MSEFYNDKCKLYYIKEVLTSRVLEGSEMDRKEYINMLLEDISPNGIALLTAHYRETCNIIYKEVKDLKEPDPEVSLLVKLRRYIESFKDDDEIKAKYLKWFFED